MAQLEIQERQAGDVTVLDINGKVTMGEGSTTLKTAVRRLVEEGKKKLLLNLRTSATWIQAASAN